MPNEWGQVRAQIESVLWHGPIHTQTLVFLVFFGLPMVLATLFKGGFDVFGKIGFTNGFINILVFTLRRRGVNASFFQRILLRNGPVGALRLPGLECFILLQVRRTPASTPVRQQMELTRLNCVRYTTHQTIPMVLIWKSRSHNLWGAQLF